MELYKFMKGVYPLQKEDIPEVERVIRIVNKIASRYWARKVDSAVDYLVQILQSYETALGAQGVDLLESAQGARAKVKALEEELDLIMATLEERLGCPLAVTEARAVEDAGRDLLIEGAAALGVILSIPGPSDVQLARRDLHLFLAGRLASQNEAIREALGAALRTTAGRQGLAVGGATRTALRRALGSQWASWGQPVVDAWAYRWHNIGRFKGGEQLNVKRWVARNPLDQRTTPFCKWVHGKVISARRVRSQLQGYASAVMRGDLTTMQRLWPLRVPREEARFRRIFGGRGLPPYHFRCRTIAVPA